MDIKNFLGCPECNLPLSDNLECSCCHHVYGFKNGVYDIISTKLSSSQLEQVRVNWVTNEMLENESTLNQLKAEWTKIDVSKNKETIEAENLHNEYMTKLIKTFSGRVCDLATGRGTFLKLLADSDNKDFYIVCTDIAKQQLMLTRKIRQTDDERIFYIATDGRYMSFKDGSFDYITSYAAFGNIPDTDKVAGEIHRILKPNGKIIIKGNYIEKDSKSFELAKNRGLERGMIEEYLINDLETAGFKNIVSTIITKAVWTQNQYNLLPMDGEMYYYGVIQADK